MEQDTADFDGIYRAYASLVFRYLLSIGCPDQEAEDIVQETFVKALLRIDGFRGDSKLSVWLCQIAKNAWLDQIKKARREVLPELSDDKMIDPYPLEWLYVVEQLDEPYQTVFLRIALECWDYDTLAKHFGKSTSWARVTYYRARMKLQKILIDGRNRNEK